MNIGHLLANRVWRRQGGQPPVIADRHERESSDDLHDALQHGSDAWLADYYRRRIIRALPE
jgi:hypothetical protein